MKQMSKAEAFRELTRWSQGSLAGLAFARSDAVVNFSMRRATLEVHEPSHLLIRTKDSCVTQVFCADDASFSLISAEEFAKEFSDAGNVTPPFATALCILFPDKDFCLIFSEG